MIIALLVLILFAILFPGALRFLFCLIILGALVVGIAASHAKPYKCDFATRTVMAWKLEAVACGEIDNLNLNGSHCMREEALDKKLTSYGCFVDSATWKCPILPGKRSP